MKKWYQNVLKLILKGIFLFLIPVIVLIFIFQKAFHLVKALILPVKEHLPAERIFGVGLLSIISVAGIILICFLAGWLAERQRVKSLIGLLEDKLLVFIPGYTLLKSSTGDALNDTNDKWQAVLVVDEEEMKIGIQVELPQNGYCTVFFPEPPDGRSGEMKIVQESKLKKLNLPVNKVINLVRKYGKGMAAHVIDKP